MPGKGSVEPTIYSFMDILFSPCDDLEVLLRLARREAVAAEQKNFGQILEVVQQRATLGDRLEIYHRQLSEFRSHLGDAMEPALHSSAAAEAAALATAIKLEDARSLPLLLAARSDALQKSLRAADTRRNLGVYAQRRQPEAMACDRKC
jgi:hypothetical protein